MRLRTEMEAQRVSPFIHAVVAHGRSHQVKRVRRHGDRVALISDDATFIRAATASVTVDVIIGDDNDPDPVGSQAAQVVRRRAAKPSWRVGRGISGPRRRPLRPR